MKPGVNSSPPYRNVLSGWSSEEPAFRLTSSGSYVQTYDGTFFEEYPRRRVCVEICRKKEQVSYVDNSCDIHFVFVLQRSDEEIIEPSFDKKNKTFTLAIRIDHPFGIPMPRDVRWIEDYLRPVVMSPAVVLSLIDYIISQAPKIDEMTENELQRIEVYSKKLNDFLTSVIFGPDLFAGLGIDVISRGEQAMRHVLFHVLKQAYPDYQTLITSPQWESLCRTYIDSLSKSSPIHTRGLETLIAQKTEIAALFGFRNHAGFESQIRQFHGLVVLEGWTGNQGEIRFQQHLGENLLLKTIARHKNVSRDVLIEEARKFGYLAEEVIYLLEFLILRGYIEKRKNGLFGSAKIISKAELIKIAKESKAEAIEMMDIVNFSEFKDLIAQDISKVKDETDLTEAQIRILRFQRTVQGVRPVVIKQLQNILAQFRADLYQKSDIVSKDIPVSSTGLFIDAHINGAQRNITAKSRDVFRAVTKLTTDVNKMFSKLSKEDFATNIADIIQKNKTLHLEIEKALKELEDLIGLINQHTEWVQLADRLLLIKKYLEIMQPDLNVKSFAIQYNLISHKLMETLSVKGLNVYTELYNKFAPRVWKLYDEISVAIKATEINDQNLRNGISGNSIQVEIETNLLSLLQRKDFLFQDVVQKSGCNAEALVSSLIYLEKQGKIKIAFILGKPNK